MSLFDEGLIVLLLILLAFACWRIIIPARELLAELQRMASGDYRPVILGEAQPIFKKTTEHLRVLAETLARQQAALTEEEFSLSMILGRMTEGVIIVGPDLRIKLMNEASAAMFNLKQQTKGLLMHEVFLSHELQSVTQKTLLTGEVQRGEFTTLTPGRRERSQLIVTAAPLKTADATTPKGLLFVLHDITRMRELEAVRREFVANVSHEFRTPLSIINGYLETLEDSKISKEMFQKSIAVMRRHGNRLNDLIEDLLTISKMEEKGVRLETTPADITPILRTVVEQMEGEIATRGAMLNLEVEGALPLVNADVYRMEQAFSNLLANALRHGRSTGGAIRILARAQGLELMVSFRDNGPGIPLADQEHIFERFYRVGGDRTRHTGGTGLGLSIVKNVIQAHGGRIVLESKPGAGSTFSIFLPVAIGPV
jgi:two-component system phosphate regulon sensor histidine kinase PhoR